MTPDERQQAIDAIKEHFPDELLQLDQWVLWRLVKRRGGDKPTKQPHSVTGSLASTTDPRTWAPFDEAARLFVRGGYDGVGFVFSETDPYTGIDFDNHCTGGEFDQWALEAVNRLDSYTEFSPSGTGAHVIVRGAMPGGRGRKDQALGLEMYDRARFFTVTGRPLDGRDWLTIPERQEAIDWLYAQFPTKGEATTAAPATPGTLDDDALLERMFSSRKGAAIRRLWEGDISAYNGDESAADLALCNHLAFWTGNDAGRIDRLFRQSGLMRDKWDRNARTGETYGQGTIREAIAGTPETYRAPTAGKFSQENPTPVGELHTDMGNAQRFARLQGSHLRYVQSWGWLFWDGRRWKVDDTGHVMRRAKEVVQGLYQDARGNFAAVDKLVAQMQTADDATVKLLKSLIEEQTSKAKQAMAWAMKSQSRSRLEAMTALAQSELPIPARPDEFDCDPWLLNVNNGAIDLRTGALLPHDAARMVTKVSPVDYDPAAQCPLWLAFLDRIFGGNADLIDYIQRVFGYTLTGLAIEQYLFVLWGSGANGKSTLIQTLLSMFGAEYSSQAAPELLIAGMSRHPTELADLRGKRLVASIEVDDGKKLAVGLTKQLTGGDRVKARYMRQDFFEFDPTHKLFLVANHKPTVDGTDPAIWRRIRLIPFEVTIPEDERDKELVTKLQAELPGVLAWCVRGLLAWQRIGLSAPETVKRATEAYQTESDALAGFIDECLVEAPGAQVQAKDLYRAYTEWCDDNGETALNSTQFGRRMVERGIDKYIHPSTRRTYYMNVGLMQ